jgi:hypothetical protein
MLLTFFIAILAVLGYFLDYFIDKKNHKKLFMCIALFCIVLTVIIIFVNNAHQEQEIRDSRGKIDEIKSQNDSLEVQFKRTTEKLEPFIRIARSNYPASNEEEALVKLETNISRALEHMQPKLIMLTDETESWKDKSSIFHTRYWFRSQYRVALKNVSIEMKFDVIILNVSGAIIGTENRTKTTATKDKRGFVFVTDLLLVGDEILIDIRSNEPPNIVSMKFFPG